MKLEFCKDSDGDGIADGWTLSYASSQIILQPRDAGPAGETRHRVADGAQAIFLAKRPTKDIGYNPYVEYCGDGCGQGIFKSAPFAVEGGALHHVRVNVAAKNVGRLHVVMYCYNDAGESVGIQWIPCKSPPIDDARRFNWPCVVRSYPVFLGPSGTWDRMDWEQVVRVPRAATNAALGFIFDKHGVRDDGYLEVCEVRIDRYSGTDDRRGEACLAPTQGNDMPEGPLQDSMVLELASGLRIGIARDGDKLLGIGEVVAGDVALRNPRHLISPAFLTESGGLFSECLLEHVAEKDDGFVVTSRLRGDSPDLKLLWKFRQKGLKLFGREVVGFSYGYEASSSEKIAMCSEVATWEVGGSLNGNTLVPGTWSFVTGDFRPVCTPTVAEMLALVPLSVYSNRQHFDYQFGAHGTLFSYFTDPMFITESLVKDAGDDALKHSTAFQFGLREKIETPPRNVCFCDENAPDLWADVSDYVRKEICERNGLRETSDEPFLDLSVFTAHTNLGSVGKADWQASRIRLSDITREWLPRMKEWGFTRAWLHSLWGNQCLVRAYHISPVYEDPWRPESGTTAFRALCDEAHRNGCQIFLWMGVAHSLDAPVVLEHPEWFVRNPDGSVFSGYTELARADFGSGYRDAFLGWMRRLKEETHLDGFWYDSFPDLAFPAVNYANPALEPQARAIFGIMREMADLGYGAMIEAVGVLGVPAQGARLRKLAPEAQPDNVSYNYRTSLLTGVWAPVDVAREIHSRLDYYRWVANKAFWHVDPRLLHEDESERQRVSLANLDYQAVRHVMHRRRLLGENGVAWDNEDCTKKALFCFEDFKFETGGFTRATDVTSGRKVPVTSEEGRNVICAEAYHTYLLESE